MEHPPHYTRGAIEPWDYIRDQGLNYHLGNAVKYISRAGYKDGALKETDLKKAIHSLQNELEHTTTLTRSSGAIPDSIRFACEWDEWTTDPEIFDR